MDFKMMESDGSDEVSDWGSDFDDCDEEIDKVPNGDIYEIPDGKPSIQIPTAVVPEWLRKVSDENAQPPQQLSQQPQVYIEHVLLPTRATKEEDSKNFIETLKRKLSQKNLLVGKLSGGVGDPKTSGEHLPIVPTDYDTDYKMKKIKESLQKFPWFYRVDRTKAELILENYMSDGSFLVRECYHGGANVPFTLTIRFGQRLFHIQIRIRADSHFALGTLKVNEMHFPTVQEMIETYKKLPLQLHTNGKFFGETKLTLPPIVYSFSN